VGYSFVNGVGQLSADGTGAGSEVEQVLLQLPLEGLLEPVTALKVAIALGREFGVDASVAQPENLRTFEDIIALVEQLRTGAAATGVSTAAKAPAAKAPEAKAPEAPAQAETVVQKSIALEEEVRRVLMDTVVAKTGYPEDMLELDLDLEADLGIDTVKQVDIFARTREAFGVPRDPNRALRDFNTLRKVIDHIVERAQATGSAPPVVAPPEEPSKRSGGGGPRSVREVLLAMDLRQAAGVTNEEFQNVATAMASRVGTPAPDTSKLRSLDDLKKKLIGDR